MAYLKGFLKRLARLETKHNIGDSAMVAECLMTNKLSGNKTVDDMANKILDYTFECHTSGVLPVPPDDIVIKDNDNV